MTQTRQVCLAALAAFLLIGPPSAQSRQIVLAWDPSPEPTATGYILLYGPLPGVYTTSVDVGNLISYQIDLPGTQHYFAVLAYNSMGLTSPLSNELAESSLIVLMNPGDQNSAAGSDVGLLLVATGVPFSYTATNLPGGWDGALGGGRTDAFRDVPADRYGELHDGDPQRVYHSDPAAGDACHGACRNRRFGGAAAARDDDHADGGRDGRDSALSIQMVGVQRHRLDDAEGLERGSELRLDADDPEPSGQGGSVVAERGE